MTRRIAITALAALLLAAPAHAQQSNPAGAAADTPAAAKGPAAEHPLNQADQTFLRDAAMGGLAEVELGKLAGKNGQSRAVKDFGQRLVEDHGKATDRLKAIAKQHSAALPGALDPEHAAAFDQLAKVRGAEFDRAFIDAQIKDHQKTAHLFEYEIGSGQNADLKAFAAETLPVILQHLAFARTIQAELGGQSR